MRVSFETKLKHLEKLGADFIGNTPFMEVSGDKREGAKIFAKIEWYNLVGGTIKDRGVYRYVESRPRRS
uniref:Pyridoxal-phosphate dependent enzyme n=1 Tax=Candidatus Kentrum sp. LFY TaxID=2126342 RepID=A0A450UD52_9GAMM|nr:MAG: Pyridoxal-phosphate dependent enzyme [Candidatus Kentron sp. LFY]